MIFESSKDKLKSLTQDEHEQRFPVRTSVPQVNQDLPMCPSLYQQE